MNTVSVLAEDDIAYGALVPGGSADVDIYALGRLAPGVYVINVMNDVWDPVGADDADVVSISLLDFSGAVLGTSLQGGLEVEVYDASTFYLRINGGQGSAQYSAVYTRTGDLPSPDHAFSNVTYALAPMQLDLTLTGSAPIDGTGNALANTLTGNAAANVLRGEGGDDWIDGGRGINTLIGGSGDDVLGGAGVDRMAGGADDDTYFVNHAGDRTIEKAGEGFDAVFAALGHTLAANVENLTIDSVGDVHGIGNASRNVLTGGAGDNHLRGLDGDDRLLGLEGDDLLDGGGGVDVMRGGIGDDTFIVDSPRDQVQERGSEGLDLVRSSVSFTLSNHVENLTLTGSAAIDGAGNGSANELRGNAAANGLKGGAGADLMSGGRGADRLEGGLDKDVLYGGGGADVFVFNSIADAGRNAKGDAIRDFAVRRDTIELSAIDADATRKGNQAFEFIEGARFSGDAGELRYKSGLVSGDTTGDGVADFHVAVTNLASLKEDDFLL